jgi:hypothetical protein
LRAVVAISVLLGLNSCHPVPARDGRVRTVAGPDLLEMYRATPTDAKLAFDGQTVRVLLTHYDKAGLPEELRYYVNFRGDKENHPAVVLRAGKTPFPTTLKGAVWVQGTCLGKVHDGKDRRAAGYDFKVVVTDCSIVPPPTEGGP